MAIKKFEAYSGDNDWDPNYDFSKSPILEMYEDIRETFWEEELDGLLFSYKISTLYDTNSGGFRRPDPSGAARYGSAVHFLEFFINDIEKKDLDLRELLGKGLNLYSEYSGVAEACYQVYEMDIEYTERDYKPMFNVVIKLPSEFLVTRESEWVNIDSLEKTKIFETAQKFKNDYHVYFNFKEERGHQTIELILIGK